jgi:hypothetical protein
MQGNGNNRNFTMTPNELTDLYTRLPDFKAEHAKLYDVILRHYNDDYGYAFPDTYDLMLATNYSESKVLALKKTLIKYGLIETERHPTFGNDVYFPQEPVESEAALYARWPDAKAHYERRRAWCESRKRSGKARKAAFDAKVKSQRERKGESEEVPNAPDIFDFL